MTENELKKTIAIYKKTLEVTADNGETCFRELDKNTLLFLEELKQYRAIGTIEEFKALKEKEERFDRNIRMFNEIGLEIRNQAITEIAERLKKYTHGRCNGVYIEVPLSVFEEIAEEMRGAE